MYRLRNQLLIGLLSLALAFIIVNCGDEEEGEVLEVSKAAYIINGAAETISVFDIETSEMKNDVATVGKWPADIRISGDNIYVVNTGDNAVQIIDLESLTDAGMVDIGEGTLPQKIGFVGANKAYVSCNGTKSVSVIDLAMRQVTRSVDVGAAPQGVGVAGQKIYVCNTNATFDGKGTVYGEGTVSVIDSSTDTVTKTIKVEINPTEIAISGTKVVVVCTGNYADITRKLCIIDAGSDAVVKTIDLGPDMAPPWIAVSPGGVAYVTSSAGLLSVDIESGLVAAPLTDFADGWGVAIDKDGNGYICVADWAGGGKDKLLVMDASGMLVGTYTPGGGASIIALKE